MRNRKGRKGEGRKEEREDREEGRKFGEHNVHKIGGNLIEAKLN